MAVSKMVRDASETALIRNNRAQFLAKRGRHKAAVRNLRAALRALRRSLPANHPYVRRVQRYWREAQAAASRRLG